MTDHPYQGLFPAESRPLKHVRKFVQSDWFCSNVKLKSFMLGLVLFPWQLDHMSHSNCSPPVLSRRAVMSTSKDSMESCSIELELRIVASVRKRDFSTTYKMLLCLRMHEQEWKRAKFAFNSLYLHFCPSSDSKTDKFTSSRLASRVVTLTTPTH